MWEVQEHTRASGTYPLVSDQVALHPIVSVGLFDRWLVYARLPVNLLMTGDKLARAETNIGAKEGPSLGPLDLGTRYLIYDDPSVPFSLGAQLVLGFPLSDSLGLASVFGGESSLSGAGQLLGEFRLGRARIDLNVGARLRRLVRVDDLKIGHEFLAALGGQYAVYDSQASRIEAILEVYGATGFANIFGREATPLEVLLGIKLFRKEGVLVGIAGGAGLLAGYGSPFYRAVLMAGYSPPQSVEVDTDADGLKDALDACPLEPEDNYSTAKFDGCPERDSDHDGIVNNVDACRDLAEDFDGFEDVDGCPEADNDRDGITDQFDKCPNVAEDRDGVDDADGCPDIDTDRDGDGLMDAADRCPDAAEDRDNFQDEDGCPDPDNDADGIADADDKCPLEPETPTPAHARVRKKASELDGCPDVVHLDPVRFETDRAVILPESFPTLRTAVDYLQQHAEIKHVSVEGHTDSQGNDARNLTLSASRAKAVREFLVAGGVAAECLGSVGYGESRPVANNASAEGRALNRRVELRIDARASDPATPD
jgi:outer membrane protein OmpA-like peptidoglycan-associated protein